VISRIKTIKYMHIKILLMVSYEFVSVESLKGELKEIANQKGLYEGLAVLETKFNGYTPIFNVITVKGSPTQFIREFAKEKGINLNEVLEKAFGDN